MLGPLGVSFLLGLLAWEQNWALIGHNLIEGGISARVAIPLLISDEA